MTPEAPDARSLALRLDAILDRLNNLEVQVRGLVTSQTVEAREFVVKDEWGEVRARLEMHEFAPRLTFFDRLGNERLRIGLRSDGMPAMWEEDREIRLGGSD